MKSSRMQTPAKAAHLKACTWLVLKKAVTKAEHHLIKDYSSF
jgi:hypothetical protein